MATKESFSPPLRDLSVKTLSTRALNAVPVFPWTVGVSDNEAWLKATALALGEIADDSLAKPGTRAE
jgi:hypothetical protein